MTSHCRFCTPDVADLAFLDACILALRDGGGLTLAPRRHVARWRDFDADELHALAAAIPRAQDLLETPGAAPAEVRFIETGGHFHLRIGQPAAATLIAGPEDALLAHLAPHVDEAEEIDAAVAFAMPSGVDLLFPRLQDLLDRDGRLRLLVGDYMGASDPEALRRLLDLPDGAQLMAFNAKGTAFHPKSWLFTMKGGAGALLVGSSNLSTSALETGVEWNLRLFAESGAPELAAAKDAFARLFARPEVEPLTHDWIDAYAARRTASPPPASGIAPEAPAPAPLPHEVQAEALQALTASRARGHRAGLVVLATGLGKTYLAAFDSHAYDRVLFVAHREEILTQAMAAFRKVRPGARLGRWSGASKDKGADILFASVQTLAQAVQLSAFDPGAFDYIVVDEFHHAAAATYRRVIAHFEPRFLLGLTATPERADGGDLLGLCGENLVFRCDMWDGIGRGLLSPFTYYGLADDADYAQIPWRGRFNEEALTNAVATHARAGAALAELAAKGGTRTIGFCVSQRHADFMAACANQGGLRAASVHSGPGSAPRSASLEALQAGDLDILFAVDMFNEGVDVPEIDTVLMLRPTESPVIWLQQFGRGLRRADGKDRLVVIDYIGAHRSFLTKARALLQAGDGDRALDAKLRDLRSGHLTLPPGCEILYETETLDILDQLLRRPASGDAEELTAFYRDFRTRHDGRPTASEVARAGFDPRRTGHGGWFDFVADQGDIDDAGAMALDSFAALLREVETSAAHGVGGLLALSAMIDEGAFPGAITIARLEARARRLALRNPKLGAGLGEAGAMGRRLRGWAAAGDGRWFAQDGETFRTRIAPSPPVGAALATMVGELVDWRIARHLHDGRILPLAPDTPVAEAAEGAAPFLRIERWREYMRDEIPPLFGAIFSSGSWNAGIVPVRPAKALILLVTLKKGALSSGNHYEDHFEDARTFIWSSQTSTKRDDARGRIIGGGEAGWTVHLFIRSGKLRNGKGAPFRYGGPAQFLDWEGDAPISVRWRLTAPVPEALRAIFAVPPDA